MQKLGLIKSHYSLGRSIITLDKPKGNLTDYPISVFDLIIQNNLKEMVLVEDSLSGLLELSKNAFDNKIKLIFGLRLSVCEDINHREEDYIKKRAKYIVFAKNSEAYKDLVKISTFANTTGFFNSPSIDFANLKKLWNNNLILSVPFYDSFLYLNSFESHQHIPDFTLFQPTFFIEDNELPFDEMLKNKVENFCKTNNFETLQAQSIYYKNKEDFLAYQTFRCITSRNVTGKISLAAPELSHCCSNTFNFDRWLENNK
jgi:DNA polymerase III alpha subunit